MTATTTHCSDCGLVIDFNTSFNDGEVSLCSDCHVDYIIRTKGDGVNESEKKT